MNWYNNKKTQKVLQNIRSQGDPAFHSALKQRVMSEYQPVQEKESHKKSLFQFALTSGAVGVAVVVVFGTAVHFQLSSKHPVITAQSFVAQAADYYSQHMMESVLYMDAQWRPGADVERYKEVMGTYPKAGQFGWDEMSWTSVQDQSRLSVKHDYSYLPKTAQVVLETRLLSDYQQYIGELPQEMTSAPLAEQVSVAEIQNTALNNTSPAIEKICEMCLKQDIAEIKELQKQADVRLVNETVLDGKEVVVYEWYKQLDERQAWKRDYYFDKETHQIVKEVHYDIMDGEQMETWVKTIVDQQWLDRSAYPELFTPHVK